MSHPCSVPNRLLSPLFQKIISFRIFIGSNSFAMKKVLLTLISLVIASGMQAQDQIFQSNKLQLTWKTEKKFSTPESVLYDDNGNVLYVSNINGKPTDEDQNGYISKISPEGSFIEEKWATGLDAPKGMGIHEGVLYVTDINELAEIDLQTGDILRRHPAPEAKFLNDIAIDADGKVYVTDMSSTTIYRLHDGEFSLWMDDDVLTGPNGLYVLEDHLFVGCMKILKISLEDRSYEVFADKTGSIDGLEYVGDDTFVYSDWTGNIFLIEAGGTPEKILDTTKEDINAADIEYVPSSRMLFVPTFFDNRVFAYELNP